MMRKRVKPPPPLVRAKPTTIDQARAAIAELRDDAGYRQHLEEERGRERRGERLDREQGINQ